MQPNQPPPHAYVVTKPGGLSGAAHAVHLLIVLFTCGLWLPVYLIIAFVSSARGSRTEVMTPYVPVAGQPPPGPAELPGQVASEQRYKALVIGACVFAVVLAVAIGIFDALR